MRFTAWVQKNGSIFTVSRWFFFPWIECTQLHLSWPRLFLDTICLCLRDCHSQHVWLLVKNQEQQQKREEGRWGVYWTKQERERERAVGQEHERQRDKWHTKSVLNWLCFRQPPKKQIKKWLNSRLLLLCFRRPLEKWRRISRVCTPDLCCARLTGLYCTAATVKMGSVLLRSKLITLNEIGHGRSRNRKRDLTQYDWPWVILSCSMSAL